MVVLSTLNIADGEKAWACLCVVFFKREQKMAMNKRELDGIPAAEQRSVQVRRVMFLVLCLNLGVALAKIFTGYAFSSGAVRADGIHSLFDAASNVVALLGVAIAVRPADVGHPYGHAKYETFASMFIGILLVGAACEVGWSAVQELLTGETSAEFSFVSVIVMVATLCINTGVTRFEHKQGKLLKSAILVADSKHTLSDVLVSASVIVGLIFVAVGFPIADAIATLIVTVAIFATAISVFKDVHDTFSDEARIDVKLIEACVMSIDGVRSCHKIRTRGLEGEVYADLHILVDPDMSIRLAHEVASRVERAVEEKFPQVCEVLVHVEPDVPEERL